MAQKLRSTVRRLVTLPVEMAEEVDLFKETSGATSDSDALKVLIGWGLTRTDRPYDLFERCKRATSRGLALGDVITSVIADHPLVASAVLDGTALNVYLKSKDLDDETQLRFCFRRDEKTWIVERTENHGREWSRVQFTAPKTNAKSAPPSSDIVDDFGSGRAGRPASRGGKADLDDDIPF